MATIGEHVGAEDFTGGYREWRLPSPLMRCAWEAVAETNGVWVQPATEFWGLGFASTAAGTSAELMGPLAAPMELPVSAGDRFWGVELHAHVFLAGIAKADIAAFQTLPVSDDTVTLGNQTFSVRGPADLGQLVTVLATAGALTADADVASALGVRPAASMPARTLRRRVLAVAGMSRQRVASVRRARAAYALLGAGMPIPEVVDRLGYADQPHLTRSLRRLAGRTPREILSGPSLTGHIVQDST